MKYRAHHPDRDEADDRSGHRCNQPTLRDHLAGPGTDGRMSGLLRMVMCFGRRERHRCTARRQYHQRQVQAESEAGYQTDHTGKSTGRHNTFLLMLLSLHHPHRSVHRCLLTVATETAALSKLLIHSSGRVHSYAVRSPSACTTSNRAARAAGTRPPTTLMRMANRRPSPICSRAR